MKMKHFKLFLLCLYGLFSSIAVHAYVTSAYLEYSVDDWAEIYLNGNLVTANTGIHWADYAVLSTSDGTLPLEYFRLNGENVLAIHNVDTGGVAMAMSYRLTVHHSQGDPVVIWGEPETTRFLHLSKDQAAPQGWFKSGFDDSGWSQARLVHYGDEYAAFAQLPEPALGGILGLNASVPHLSHRPDSRCNAGDHNLFRSRFRFPYAPAQTKVLVNPPQADAGQPLALRLLPGGDAADIGDFTLFADLPAGLDLARYPQGAVIDRSKRRVAWTFPSEAQNVTFTSLPANQVVEAPGWESPFKVLGGWKSGKPSGPHPGIPDAQYNDGASFFPGPAGKFKIASPPPSLQKSHPVILGVIFHSQLMSGGRNTARTLDADGVEFNYSIGNDRKAVLEEPVNVARISYEGSWYDGYYDATEDRDWTWEDLENLTVSYRGVQTKNPDRNRMASTWVVVKAFNPMATAPVLYAKVASRRCETLEVKAGLYSQRFAMAAADRLEIPVNQRWCPTPTALPTPAVIAGRPEPTPLPKGPRLDPGKVGLTNLRSSPEPFKAGGVFLFFDLKVEAEVVLKVYDQAGKMVRTVSLGTQRPGNRQVFFNGMDDGGKPLRPGSYRFEFIASNEEVKSSKSAPFTKVKDKGYR